MTISRNWGGFSSTAQLPNSAAALLQSSALLVGDRAYVSNVIYVCTTATQHAAVWQHTISSTDLTAEIPDPPAASTGNVVIDATSLPRMFYYMAPSANSTFDPTATLVSQCCTIIKTTVSAFKITLPATPGWTYFPAGAANTALDLPGSDVSSATAYHAWTLVIDFPRKTVSVSPAA
jgi:hypothetical protein